MKKKEKTPQKIGDYEIGYKKPPQTEASKKTRFGGERGNPQGHGYFKVQNSARYKLELMIKLPAEELEKIKDDENASKFERDLAKVILDENLESIVKWKILKEMIDEVYGTPAQTQVNLTSEMSEKEKSGFIKGVFIPNDERGTNRSR